MLHRTPETKNKHFYWLLSIPYLDKDSSRRVSYRGINDFQFAPADVNLGGDTLDPDASCSWIDFIVHNLTTTLSSRV
jgi:hypothetical protein